MQTESRILDELARLAAGAASSVVGMRDEARAQMRARAERLAHRLDLVTREEYEAVRAMAAKAREQQEALAVRIAALEDQLAAASKPARRPRTARASRQTKV